LTPLLERGREAPSFELPAVQGSPVSLRQLRGRVVLLSFWNSWAEPCEKSLAVVQDLSEKYAGDSLSVVGINVYEDDGVAVAELVRRRGITYPCLIDDGQVARQYRVPGVPALYLINQQGAVIFSTTGTSRLAELPAAIDEALATVR
jgi:peroxiredoxin